MLPFRIEVRDGRLALDVSLKAFITRCHLRHAQPKILHSLSTIHAQLGHPSLSKLHKLMPNLSKVSNLHCESCQLGKHTRGKFPNRFNKRVSSPFALVHTDV